MHIDVIGQTEEWHMRGITNENNENAIRVIAKEKDDVLYEDLTGNTHVD